MIQMEPKQITKQDHNLTNMNVRIKVLLIHWPSSLKIKNWIKRTGFVLWVITRTVE